MDSNKHWMLTVISDLYILSYVSCEIWGHMMRCDAEILCWKHLTHFSKSLLRDLKLIGRSPVPTYKHAQPYKWFRQNNWNEIFWIIYCYCPYLYIGKKPTKCWQYSFHCDEAPYDKSTKYTLRTAKFFFARCHSALKAVEQQMQSRQGRFLAGHIINLWNTCTIGHSNSHVTVNRTVCRALQSLREILHIVHIYLILTMHTAQCDSKCFWN